MSQVGAHTAERYKWLPFTYQWNEFFFFKRWYAISYVEELIVQFQLKGVCIKQLFIR